MKPYFEDKNIKLYHADCRDLLADDICGNASVLTGPPWFEHPTVASSVVNDLYLLGVQAAIIQWTEMQKPPTAIPLVAVHAWVHADRHRYQPFYHFARHAERQESQGILCLPEYPDHPHQFPEAVAEWLLRKLPANLPVVDPFCGSGTVLVAAQMLNRVAIGIEIEEKYAEVAANRLRLLDSAYKR